MPISLKIALARATNVKECVAVERTGSEPPDEATHSLVDVCERIQSRCTHHRGRLALRVFLDLGCQLRGAPVARSAGPGSVDRLCF